jgi:hypothetical protein
MVLLKAGKNLGSGILVKYWQAQRFYQKKQKNESPIGDEKNQ